MQVSGQRPGRRSGPRNRLLCQSAPVLSRYADLSKATQNREAIGFCDHWKAVSGHDPKMLIVDQ